MGVLVLWVVQAHCHVCADSPRVTAARLCPGVNSFRLGLNTKQQGSKVIPWLELRSEAAI